MPLPFSIAFMAMQFSRRMHNAPVHERPKILRKVYFLRVAAYVAVGASSLALVNVDTDRAPKVSTI